MEIRTTSHFVRRYKKLPSLIKRKAVEREKIFIKNPFDPRLNTHIFVGKDEILYTDAGTHDEVY